MAKKIFVSYKHKDSSVRPIPGVGLLVPTTARHYVEQLIGHLDAEDHIYKGEGNEDLSSFKDDTIQSRLKDKIFDSTVTVVLISKNMKDHTRPEDDQWIPWEVAYSLREKSREDRTSRTNAFLAVVLPDENNSYTYFIEEVGCQNCRVISIKTNTLFSILEKNMFNRRQPKKGQCTNAFCGTVHHTGYDHSYIYPVKWDDFISNIDGHIGVAIGFNENLHEYTLTKEI